MRWEEFQRIDRDLVNPEMSAWLDGTSPSADGEVDRSPIWVIQSVVKAAKYGNSTNNTLLAMLDRESPTGVGEVADAMVVCLQAKHGIIEFSDPEQVQFISRLERRLRPLGPFDDFSGRGPGRAIAYARDELGRLHNANGPALEFRDRQFYCLRGVHVPLQVWRARNNAKEILRVGNVEVTRVLIDLYGVKAWLKDAELKPVHSDRFGTFYRLSDLDGGLGYVHVVCPSTGQEYFMAVPGNCRTAHEAVAWTFSMVPEDYNPVQEA